MTDEKNETIPTETDPTTPETSPAEDLPTVTDSKPKPDAEKKDNTAGANWVDAMNKLLETLADGKTLFEQLQSSLHSTKDHYNFMKDKVVKAYDAVFELSQEQAKTPSEVSSNSESLKPTEEEALATNANASEPVATSESAAANPATTAEAKPTQPTNMGTPPNTNTFPKPIQLTSQPSAEKPTTEKPQNVSPQDGHTPSVN